MNPSPTPKVGDRLRCDVRNNNVAKFGYIYVITKHNIYTNNWYRLKLEGEIEEIDTNRTEGYLLNNFTILNKEKFYLDI